MKYQETIDYPVPCERLLGIFTQPDFVLAKYAAQGASNIQPLAHSHDGDIRVSVPLVGGKLEKLLADDLQLKFKHDTEVSLALVASR